MSIEEIIFKHSKETPDKVALISGQEEITYSELWNRIANAAFCLSESVERGDRIIISASKNIDFVYTYFGAHLAGVIGVPIDPDTNEVRLKRIVTCANPKLIVGDLHNRGNFDVIPFPSVSKGVDDRKFGFPEESDTADLLFTTGTTGLPKGVTLTFGNQLAAAVNINSFIRNKEEDVELLALPISHSFGLGRLRCVFLRGATLVMLGSFASMKKFFGEMERCNVTGFGMVPASWSYIIKMSGDRIGRYSSQLNYIEIGSAFMPLDSKKKLMSLLPRTRICMHYGLTEASRSAFISFRDDEAHLDSVGKATPNTEVKVFDGHGNAVENGADGEICVKGKHVCSGYWGLPESEFKNDFHGSYFKTGDWGHIDKDGYIYLVSRKKEIINVGGKKVSPLEVEEALNAIGGVEESACIGVPDEVLGEVVKAYIVTKRDDLDVVTIKKLLFNKLENFKVPLYVERINEIPKTASGKIQRLLLKK